MFIPTHKLITDYKITYEYDVPETAYIYDMEFKFEVSGCKTYEEAYTTWIDNKEKGMIKDWIIEPVVKTRSQVINAEVYELVLADLFEGDFGMYVYVDQDDAFELEPELEGLEKLLLQHEAQLKYDSKR